MTPRAKMAAPSSPLPLGWEGAPFFLFSFLHCQSLALALLSSDFCLASAVHRRLVRLAILGLVVLVTSLSRFFLLGLLHPLLLALLVAASLAGRVLRLLRVVLVDPRILHVLDVLLLPLEAVVRLYC